MRAAGVFGIRVAAWMVLLAAVGVLAAALVVPRLAGATPYAVLTGSMRPGLPPGTLVVVRPVESGSLGVGDVVTYQLESGQPAVVTHRIVEVRQRVDGDVRFRTQGDANPVPDQGWVRPEQVRGGLWYSVPWVGRLYGLAGPRTREVAVVGVAGALACYATWMFLGAARDRRRPGPPRRRATRGTAPLRPVDHGPRTPRSDEPKKEAIGT